jgi:hypothetical protein
MTNYSCRGEAAPFTFGASDEWTQMEVLASLERRRREKKLAQEAIKVVNEEGENDG